jgi:hypothetical protein
MVNSFWLKCSRSPKLLLLGLEYDTDFIFNVNIPEDARKSYYEKCVQCLNLEKNEKIAIAEKETETAKKETETAKKEIETAKKETETAKREKTEVEKALSQQLHNIQEITRDNSLMAPRAVIEFVETFVFNKYNVSGSSRSAKWEKFFTDVSIGQRILQCTTKKIPLWSSKAKAMAERVSDIHRSSSDYHHKTSLEIESTKELDLSKSAVVQQTLEFLICVAEHCELKLTI